MEVSSASSKTSSTLCYTKYYREVWRGGSIEGEYRDLPVLNRRVGTIIEPREPGLSDDISELLSSCCGMNKNQEEVGGEFGKRQRVLQLAVFCCASVWTHPSYYSIHFSTAATSLAIKDSPDENVSGQ